MLEYWSVGVEALRRCGPVAFGSSLRTQGVFELGVVSAVTVSTTRSARRAGVGVVGCLSDRLDQLDGSASRTETRGASRGAVSFEHHARRGHRFKGCPSNLKPFDFGLLLRLVPLGPSSLAQKTRQTR